MSIAGFVDADVDKVACVFAVEDRVVRFKADRHRVPPQDEIRDAVKRPAPDAMHILRAGQRLDAPQHLARRAVGKCREHNSLRRNAVLDQIRDAIGDRPRLARARTGDDKRGLRLGRDDAKLLFVKFAAVTSQLFGQLAVIAF